MRPASKVLGPDGLSYSPEEDKRLNDTLRAAFGSAAGREALAYLRSITIEMVAGPNITDAELRHREGARHLVAVIEARIRKGSA